MFASFVIRSKPIEVVVCTVHADCMDLRKRCGVMSSNEESRSRAPRRALGARNDPFYLDIFTWRGAVDVRLRPTAMAYHLPIPEVKPVMRRVRNHRSGHPLT